MAKVKVKVGVYAKGNRYEECEVISQEQYDEQALARANEIYEDEREFFDWLEEHFDVEEVWKMTDEEKTAVREKAYSAHCKNWAYDDMADEYDYFEIETEVDCPCECHNE